MSWTQRNFMPLGSTALRSSIAKMRPVVSITICGMVEDSPSTVARSPPT